MSSHQISWPTRRLFMAEINNADGLDEAVHPVCLQTCLESVQDGYEPYANFPDEFVVEEIKLLQVQCGKNYEVENLLTDRDWHVHDHKCGQSKAGDPPLEVQIDYDLAHFIKSVAECNGIDINEYVNNLLEKAVLEEGGIDGMILSRSQVIDGNHVEAGAFVTASQYHGEVGDEERFSKRTIHVQIDKKIIQGVVSLADLLKPEDATGYEMLERRVRAAVVAFRTGINKIERLTSQGKDDPEPVLTDMVRVQTTSVPDALRIKKALEEAGLVVYHVSLSNPPVLHVRV